MKKICLCVIPVIMLFASCASSGYEREPETLDLAMEKIVKMIDYQINSGGKIALLNYYCPSDKFSGYILDDLEELLMERKKFTVIGRAQMDKIRREMGISQSGSLDNDTIKAVGERLGAQFVVSGGSLARGDGGRYYMRLLVIDIQTARNTGINSAIFDGDERVRILVGQVKLPNYY